MVHQMVLSALLTLALQSLFVLGFSLSSARRSEPDDDDSVMRALISSSPALTQALALRAERAIAAVSARVRRVSGVACVTPQSLLWSPLPDPLSASSPVISVSPQLLVLPIASIQRVLVNASGTEAEKTPTTALIKIEWLDATQSLPAVLILQCDSVIQRDEFRTSLVRVQQMKPEKSTMTLDPRISSSIELRDMYTSLVVNGPLTPEEFWELHSKGYGLGLSSESMGAPVEASLREGHNALEVQRRGIPSTLPASSDMALMPSKESADSVQYDLTPARIHQLFVTYAGLQRAFVRLVPTKFSEEEFWTKFFQSQHFRRSSTSSSSNLPVADDIFASKELDAIEKEARTDRLHHVQQSNDLSKDDSFDVQSGQPRLTTLPVATDSKLSAREYKRSERYKQQLELIRKVNRHAALLVEGLATDEISLPPRKRARHEAEVETGDLKFTPDDLLGESTEGHIPLNEELILDNILENPTAPPSNAKPSSLLSWSPNPLAFASVKPLDNSVWSSMCQSPSTIASDVTYQMPSFRAQQELLRHWWSAVRRKDQAKLVRLRPALVAARSELSPMKHEAIYFHNWELMDVALRSKYS